MGAMTDKIKGATNEAIGKAKRSLGDATGDEELKGEGWKQQEQGRAQKALGEAEADAKDDEKRAAAEKKS
jgi:uncharacterized protein YjbJ (UPF0337 family)